MTNEDINYIPLQVKISIFTNDDVPEEVAYNRQGCPILEGITERFFSPDSIVQFDRLAFKEVTSHLPRNMIFIVAQALNRDDVLPQIIEGVVIKSRKS